MSNIHIDLIRYLFVLEVNTSLVYLPKTPAIDLSLMLGRTIADRLPIVEARAWKKSLSSWDNSMEQNDDKYTLKIIYEKPWPIDFVIFWYPAKKSYGKGEIILFELKLLGNGADNQFFIELILPAMEQLAITPDINSKNSNNLWGHFDIRSVYSGIGNLWKPLLKNGRLDSRRKVDAMQWQKGLKFKPNMYSRLNQLRWLSPFMVENLTKNSSSMRKRTMSTDVSPSMSSILEAVAKRISSIMFGKNSRAENFLESLSKKESLLWEKAVNQAKLVNISNTNSIKTLDQIYGVIKLCQIFDTKIPDEIIQYLGLGSILHIGESTHFGYGTYYIS